MDPKVPTMAVDEFASTPVEELERNIEGAKWKFAESSDPVILQKDKLETEDVVIEGKHLHRSKACKAHQATNLFCGFLIPRAAQRAMDADKDDKVDKYRLEKLALLKDM